LFFFLLSSFNRCLSNNNNNNNNNNKNNTHHHTPHPYRVFTEPKSGKELDPILEDYYSHLDASSTNKAILFAVCRGRLFIFFTEIYDFKNYRILISHFITFIFCLFRESE